MDQLQRRRHRPGHVPEPEGHQQHGGLRLAPEIADLLQALHRPGQGVLLPLRLDEEGVDVDGPVVADPGDVQAQLGHGPAGLEEGPHVVGHGGDEGLSHVSLLIVSSLVSYHGGVGMKSPA